MLRIKALLSILLVVIMVLGGWALTKNAQFTYAQTSTNDWPMFHYDPAHTGYTPTQALTSPPVVIWSSPSQTIELQASETSPVVANGMVYITSGDLFAYNASTGKQIWDVSNGGTNPIVNGNIVYAGGIAYNAFTGAELWSPNPAGATVCQAFSNGYLYVQQYTANFPQVGAHVDALLCLNATTGAQIWSAPTNFIGSDAAVADGMLYMAGSYNGSNGKLYAFSASTGAEAWSFPVSYVQTNAQGDSPAVYGGIVYTVSSDDNVYALNATDGAKIWDFKTGFFVESCPAVANGVVYVSSDDGNLYALNAENGAEIWNYTTSGGASSPAVAGNVVYVGGVNGNLYALDASNGNKLWNFTLQPPSNEGQLYDFLCSPAVVNGRVYIGSNTHVVTVLGEASNITPTPSSTPKVPELSWPVTAIFVVATTAIVFLICRKRLKTKHTSMISGEKT